MTTTGRQGFASFRRPHTASCTKGLAAAVGLMDTRRTGNVSSLSAPDGNQHALRKAGEEFFEQFLEQARKGRNPLDAAPRTKRKADVEIGDAEDLETVGRILPYVFGVLLFASAAARLVMAKVTDLIV